MTSTLSPQEADLLNAIYFNKLHQEKRIGYNRGGITTREYMFISFINHLMTAIYYENIPKIFTNSIRDILSNLNEDQSKNLEFILIKYEITEYEIDNIFNPNIYSNTICRIRRMENIELILNKKF